MSNPYQRKRSKSGAIGSQEEFQKKQYLDFLHKIVKQNHVWALASDHWALCATSYGTTAMPVWADQSLAILNANKDWESYQPKAIDLAIFMQQILPHLVQNNILISIDRTAMGEAIYVEPRLILEHIVLAN